MKNESAFPQVECETDKIFGEDQESPTELLKRFSFAGGLTKREYFAGLAMQGMLAGGELEAPNEGRGIAMRASMYADSLIAELEKEKKDV